MFIYKKVFLLTFALSVWTSEGRGGAKPIEPVHTAVAILENGNYQICSGTILSNYWVLAASQCFEHIKISDITVVAGAMMLFSGEGVKVRVKRIVTHPSFKNDYLDNDDMTKVLDWDLALLELQESLEIDSNEGIAAAVLPPPSSRHPGKPITTGGWDPLSQVSVNTTITTTLDCLKTHPDGNFDDGVQRVGSSGSGGGLIL